MRAHFKLVQQSHLQNTEYTPTYLAEYPDIKESSLYIKP